MSEKKPSDVRISAIAPFGLRMLPDLRARVEEAAEANGRSMNAEIVARLERSLSLTDAAPKAAILAEQIVAKVIERVEKIRFEADDEIKALQEENRKLREAANSQSPKP